MNVQKMIQKVEKAQGIYDTRNYRYTVVAGVLMRKPIGIIGTLEAFTREWEIVGAKETASEYMPAIDNAIPPEDLEEMDADLEDALDDMAGDPLDMLEALLDPEEYLRKLDEKLTIWGQDTAELDPAELWKGFGI